MLDVLDLKYYVLLNIYSQFFLARFIYRISCTMLSCLASVSS